MSNNPNYYEAQRLRSIRRKLELVESIGGKCIKCGYNKNLSALEFHHKNPKDKSFNLDARNIANRSAKVVLEEVNKCELVCANCHRELHNEILEIETLDSWLKTQKEVYTKSLYQPTKKQAQCSHCRKSFDYVKGKIFCSEQCNYDNKGYPSFEALVCQYNIVNSWQKVADHFNITRRITQYIRRRHKQLNS